MKTHLSRKARVAALVGAAVAMPALAQIDVIYTKISGHPTAVVPGAKDLAGNPVATDFRAMENLFGSPDGTRWFLKGRTQLGSDLETVLLLGGGDSGTALVQEGQPAVGGGFYDFIGSGVGRFDDVNNAAFSVRCRAVQEGSGSLPNGHRVLRYTQSSGALSLAFAQGDPYTGLQDTNPSGDELVGNSVGSIHLLNNGLIGCQDSTIVNIHTSRRPAIFYYPAMFQQRNVTSVNALGGLGSRLWDTLDANEFQTTTEGGFWIAQGAVMGNGDTPTVLVVNGNAVLQENEPISGGPVIMGDVFQTVLAASGEWISRGRDNSGSTAAAPDWVVLGGFLRTTTGQPITVGSIETWGPVISAVTVDNAGNFAVIGNTVGAEPSNDTVLVYNNQTVLMREGDRVDLNDNGLPDDDAFIGRGNNTLDAFSANNVFIGDGHVYVIANLRDGAGNDLNSTPAFGTPNALLRVAIPGGTTCDGDVNCDGNLDGFDVQAAEQAVGGDMSDFCQADPDFNGDGNLDGFDVQAVEAVVGGAECP